MYKMTDRGLEIASESGLEDFTAKFIDDAMEIRYKHPAIVDVIVDRHQPLGRDDTIDTSIKYAFEKLNNANDRYHCARGLDINKDHKWRSIGGLAVGTLFPVQQLNDFQRAEPRIDAYVLSGIVGLNFINHRNQVHLLAKNRYGDYGFESYRSALGFAGAYIIGEHANDLNRRLQTESGNQFEYVEGNVKNVINVGASLHGDFRITQTSSLIKDIISPLNESVEFSPNKGITIAGYHSCEVMILTDLLVSTLLDGGIDELKKCISEFEYIYQNLGDDYRRGNFGDFGDDMSDHYALSSLADIIEDKSYAKKTDKPLTAIPYLPQSPTLLATYSDDAGGIILANIEKSEYSDSKAKLSDENSIHIKKAYREAFFTSLVGQTKAGLGRTSPIQLINIIKMSRDLVSGKSMEEIVLARYRSAR